MKFYTTLLLALLIGLLIYLTRRRLKLALVSGGIAYLVLLPARLLLDAGNVAERFDDLLPIAAVVFGVWALLTWGSTVYERRKRGARSTSGARRTPRRSG